MDTLSKKGEEVPTASTSLDLSIPTGGGELTPSPPTPPATTVEPMVTPSATPLFSREVNPFYSNLCSVCSAFLMHADTVLVFQGYDLSELLAFDPALLELAPSAASEEPQPPAMPAQIHHLQALLASPIDTLVDNTEEVKRVLEEIKDKLPLLLQMKLLQVANLSFFGPMVRLARERISQRQAQLPLKTEISSRCKQLNEKKAILDAKTDTSSSTAELANLKRDLEQLEERVRAAKQLIQDKEASIAKTQAEAETLKVQLKTDLSEVQELTKQLVSGTDEDDEAEIAEVDNVRADALHALEALFKS